MKKSSQVFILTFLMTLSGLLSCNSCVKKNTTVGTEQVSTDSGSSNETSDAFIDSETSINLPVDKTVSGDTWELVVPLGWEPKDSGNPKVPLTIYNESNKWSIMFLKEQYPGLKDQYVIEQIRGLRGAGGKLVTASEVELNGNKFTLLEAKKDTTAVWAWVTVKDGWGYAFTCGGDYSSSPSVRDACFKISSSLKIR